ncbi:MAG: hypothetical protein ACI9K3_000844, partial [Halovenus sp.]
GTENARVCVCMNPLYIQQQWYTDTALLVVV